MEVLEVYMTGFGRFRGQSLNPTSTIIHQFTEYFNHSNQRKIPNNQNLVSESDPFKAGVNDLLSSMRSNIQQDVAQQNVINSSILDQNSYVGESLVNSIFTNTKPFSLLEMTQKLGKDDICTAGGKQKKEAPLSLCHGVDICGTEVIEVSVKAVEEAVPRIHNFTKHFFNHNLSKIKKSIEASTLPVQAERSALPNSFTSKLNSLEVKASVLASHDEISQDTSGSLYSDASDSSPSICEALQDFLTVRAVVPHNEKLLCKDNAYVPESCSSGKLLTTLIPNDVNGTQDSSPTSETATPASNATSGDTDEYASRFEKFDCLVGKSPHQECVKKKLILHLGVDANAKSLRLEKTAYNVATFSVPDERGFQPNKKPILGNGSDTKSTFLPVELLQKLLEAMGFNCFVSHDPGRYLCNYIYYHSLSLSEKSEIPVLFVHVPTFDIVPMETQMEFLAHLLQCLRILMFSKF